VQCIAQESGVDPQQTASYATKLAETEKVSPVPFPHFVSVGVVSPASLAVVAPPPADVPSSLSPHATTAVDSASAVTVRLKIVRRRCAR
jgi:hypothetical protein